MSAIRRISYLFCEIGSIKLWECVSAPGDMTILRRGQMGQQTFFVPLYTLTAPS